MAHQLIRLREHPGYKQAASEWFHSKWGVPIEAYLDSMDQCIRQESTVPQWYLVMDQERIIGGLGIIENDFHDRKDLAPNVCAVFVEEDCRCQKIAGRMLDFACRDMMDLGIDTLYLMTDHTSFYERYGWTFLCMVQGDGDPEPSRMYVHRYSSPDSSVHPLHRP